MGIFLQLGLYSHLHLRVICLANHASVLPHSHLHLRQVQVSFILALCFVL